MLYFPPALFRLFGGRSKYSAPSDLPGCLARILHQNAAHMGGRGKSGPITDFLYGKIRSGQHFRRFLSLNLMPDTQRCFIECVPERIVQGGDADLAVPRDFRSACPGATVHIPHGLGYNFVMPVYLVNRHVGFREAQKRVQKPHGQTADIPVFRETVQAEYLGSAAAGDGPTGMEVIQQKDNSEAIYDLSGRKVGQVKKGIYIKNGKKFLR